MSTRANEIMDNRIMAGIVAEASFPISHSAVLPRQIIMETVMEDTFAGMPWQVRQGICENFGVTYYFSYFKATPNPLSEISSLYFPLHVPSTFLRIHACILPNPSPHIECSGARSSGPARLHFRGQIWGIRLYQNPV